MHKNHMFALRLTDLKSFRNKIMRNNAMFGLKLGTTSAASSLTLHICHHFEFLILRRRISNRELSRYHYQTVQRAYKKS